MVCRRVPAARMASGMGRHLRRVCMRVLGVSCVFVRVLLVPGVPLFVAVDPAAVAIMPFPAIEVVNPALVDVGEFPVIEEMAAFPISAVEA